MIGNRQVVTVRLEIDIDVIKGELPILRQNALEHPVEKLVAMWADQIKQARLVALIHRLENHADKKERRRKRDEVRREPSGLGGDRGEPEGGVSTPTGFDSEAT
jgi:hypothetical protein